MSLQSSCIAFWKLGESSGNSRQDSIGTSHASETGGSVGSAAGKLGDCAIFLEGPYLSVADSTLLSQTGLLLVACWAKKDPANFLDFPAIAGKWTADNRSYSLRYERIANKYIFSASSDGVVGFNATANNFGAVPGDTLNFLAGYVDTTNDLIGISVDNGTPNTTGFTGNTFDGNAPFDIGHFGTADNTWRGGIDALGLYVPASASEIPELITALWNNGNGLEPPFNPTLNAISRPAFFG